MTVKAIRLQNFMAFEDTGWIEFRPITLLFGRNSSGKSAIIRALRLLKQSLYASPTDGPLLFAAQEGLNQGSFRETIHNQKIDQPMVFHFRCRLGKSLHGLAIGGLASTSYDSISKEEFQENEWDWADLSLGFIWEQKNGQPLLSTLSLLCPWMSVTGKDREAAGDRGGVVLAASKQDLGGEWTFASDFADSLSKQDEEGRCSSASLELLAGFLPQLHRGQVTSQEPEFPEFLLIQKLIAECRQSITLFLKSIEYLGPIRPEPQRVYTFDSSRRQRLQRRGLSAWSDFLQDEVEQEKVKQVKSWLRHLDLAQDMELEKTELKHTPATISALRIYEAKANPAINLKDIGYGASQVLPVIVQSVLARVGSLVMIEQPELHLHPSAQAQMADLFIDAIARHASVAHNQDEAEEEIARTPHFLLETHSEYLLLRLRRRIAETSNRKNRNSTDSNLGLDQDDLAVYFVHRVDGISSVEEIKISNYGEFLNVPEGFGDFFSDDLIETAKLAQERLRAGLMWRKPIHDHSN